LNVGLDASTLVASVKRLGEKSHESAVELSRKISTGHHRGVCSSLALIEVPGALSSTTMPVDKIYEVTASLAVGFAIDFVPFEANVDRTIDLMLEFRELKRMTRVGFADFHYLASSFGEGCRFFVTTDEKHLLRTDVREAFSKYIRIVSPSEALKEL